MVWSKQDIPSSRRERFPMYRELQLTLVSGVVVMGARMGRDTHAHTQEEMGRSGVLSQG